MKLIPIYLLSKQRTRIETDRKNNLKFSFSDYFLMFFLIGMSANPYMAQNAKYLVMVLLIFMLLKYQSKILKSPLLDFKAIIIILFLLSFQFIHSIIYNLNNTGATIKLLLFYLFAYFVVKVLNKNFLKIFVNTMYFLTVVSLIFYSLSLIRPIESILYEFASRMFTLSSDYSGYSTPTLLVYTFDPAFHNDGSLILRNAGFTWEAGAFGFFVNIAFFFEIILNKIKMINLFQFKKAIVFLIAIILTFSTSSYLILLSILFFISYKKKGFKKFFFITLFIIIIFITYNKIDFMGNKIEEQLSIADRSQNRFGSLLLDWKDIKQKPFIGWSRDEKVLFGNMAYTQYTHRPNGISNIIRTNGIVYFLFFIIVLYKSFSSYLNWSGLKDYKIFSLFLIFIILLAAFSQILFGRMIINSFLFFFIIKKKKSYRKFKYGK